MKTIITLLSFAFLLPAMADVPVMSKAEALKQGFRPVAKSKMKSVPGEVPFPVHGLNWPVPFQDAAHTVGNSMAQYQEYGDGEAYWHGGDDLRTARKAWITSPVAGKLNGCHYTYITNADGSMTKQIRPWPQTGQASYFEISITTPEGYRFELHHVDRQTLTPEIVALLNKGNASIPAGTVIGQVVNWPTEKPSGQPYYHVHYNIMTPEDKELNPEHYSPLIPDTSAPTIHGVYARYGNSYEKITERSTLTRTPDELIVANTDVKDGNSYIQPTDYIALISGNKTNVMWDLRERLLTPAGTYPVIREHFLENMRIGFSTLRTQGNYNNDFFLARLPLKNKLSGEVEIQVKDQAGNQNRFFLTLP